MAVFDTVYAGQYDTLYVEKDYLGECELITSALARFDCNAKSLLDIGCGTGTHALEFARRGLECVGVDMSAHMLEVAKHKTAIGNVAKPPRWIVGDARNFNAEEEFDAVTMMFAVVSYLSTNEDVLAGLRNVRKHLKKGGLFLCDFWYGPAVLSVRPTERVRVLETPNGRTIRAAATTLDTINHTGDVSFRLWKVDQNQLVDEVQETHKMRYFFPQEFKLLLEMADMECVHMSPFPHLDGILTDESWNAFCVSRAK